MRGVRGREEVAKGEAEGWAGQVPRVGPAVRYSVCVWGGCAGGRWGYERILTFFFFSEERGQEGRSKQRSRER